MSSATSTAEAGAAGAGSSSGAWLDLDSCAADASAALAAAAERVRPARTSAEFLLQPARRRRSCSRLVSLAWHMVQSVRRFVMSHSPPPSATGRMWSACQNMPSAGFSNIAFRSLKPALSNSWCRSGGDIAFTRSKRACASSPQTWQTPCSTAKIWFRAAAMLDFTRCFSSQAGEQKALPGGHFFWHQAHSPCAPSAAAVGFCLRRLVLCTFSALRWRSIFHRGMRRVWSASCRCSVLRKAVHSRRKASVVRTSGASASSASGRGGPTSRCASQSTILKLPPSGRPSASRTCTRLVMRVTQKE
mmetsp:Transcript_47198/g.140886  ORF Transcript_47198/g.140886 Transcript_47198/m.140886 type:complete len:303 (-) Transcript_47198:722-1630(-)